MLFLPALTIASGREVAPPAIARSLHPVHGPGVRRLPSRWDDLLSRSPPWGVQSAWGGLYPAMRTARKGKHILSAGSSNRHARAANSSLGRNNADRSRNFPHARRFAQDAPRPNFTGFRGARRKSVGGETRAGESRRGMQEVTGRGSADTQRSGGMRTRSRRNRPPPLKQAVFGQLIAERRRLHVQRGGGGRLVSLGSPKRVFQ